MIGVAGVVPALVADDEVGVRARRSVAFPLPSSPHWVPTRIVTGTVGFYPGGLRAPRQRHLVPSDPHPLLRMR